MTITIENNVNTKSFADRESAIRTIDMEIEAIKKLKDSVVLQNLSLARPPIFLNLYTLQNQARYSKKHPTSH